MSPDLEGVCDGCGTAGLVGDTCPCGGIFRDLNVGLDEEKLDHDPDTYPKSVLSDDDVVSLDDLEKPDAPEEIE